jgi:hypothetical protein
MKRETVPLELERGLAPWLQFDRRMTKHGAKKEHTMNRRFVGCVFASILGFTLSAFAQDPAPSQPQSAGTNAVTIEGCLMREVDAPGRRPPDVERARVRADNEYVLTDTKMVKGSEPANTETPPAGEKPVGTSGAASAPLIYKVEAIDKDELAKHRGRRVQVEGVLTHLDRADNRPSPATDLVEIRGTSIRDVAGECPAK